MAIIKSKTLTIAVPIVFTGRIERPAIWSATTRPWRFAKLANGTSVALPSNASLFSAASPTA